MNYLWIALGGAAGAIARYWLGTLIYARFGTKFPCGTFAINISGCFLIGLLITILDATNQPESGLAPDAADRLCRRIYDVLYF